MSYKAVLFDFDGVIADTILYHVQAWQIAFADYGVNIVPDDIYYREGKIANLIAPLLAESKGLQLSKTELQKIVDKKREAYQKVSKAKVYPEVRELIVKLKERGIKLGLVTGSIIKNMLVVADQEFLNQFGAIVTGDSVRNNKPHPEPFLTGAEKLNVDPKNCIVIENAPLGIQAAKTAGMFCVAVQTTIKDKNVLKEADLIIENISEFPIGPLFEKSEYF